MEFDLDRFLITYKPKDLNQCLKKYLECEKLKGYTVLKHNNIDQLEKGRMWIKYIPIDKSFHNKKYDTHIKSGGILLAGGDLERGIFKSEKNRANWKYLLLRFEDAMGEEVLINISLRKNYVFFRDVRKNDLTREHLIELLD